MESSWVQMLRLQIKNIMDQTRNMKNHLKVTEGLLALTKTRLKKKKLSKEKNVPIYGTLARCGNRKLHRGPCLCAPSTLEGRRHTDMSCRSLWRWMNISSHEGWCHQTSVPPISLFSDSVLSERFLVRIWLFHAASSREKMNWIEDASIGSPWQSTIFK